MARRKYKANRRLYEKKITIIDKHGIERRKSIYAPTQSELEAKARKAIEENKRGLFINDDITIGQYCDRWLNMIRDKCADNTYKSYGYSVKHIRETVGAIRLSKLRRQDIQAAVNSFTDQPRTAQILRMTINRICKSAVDDGLMARNPCRNIELPAYKATEKRGLTWIEQQAIERANLSDEERLYISLLYYCGLRRGEALALGRGDIDLKRNILTVNHSLAFIDYKGVLKDPKTKTSCRAIPIPAELHNQLEAYDYDLYLFTRNGDFFTHSVYVKFWARIIRKINTAAGGGSIDRVQGLTAHIFRHNYASLLYKQGVDIKTAQRLLGHATVAVTMDIYTHLEELDADTISAINDVFSEHRA